MHKVRIIKKGIENFKPIDIVKIKTAMENTVKRVNEEIIESARMDYISKRKSTDPVSLVIDSMSYNIRHNGELHIISTIFCDGSKAPHAIYVHEDRTLKNGALWKGYKFLDAGASEKIHLLYDFFYEELDTVGGKL